jgi:hypothetical protein
MVARKPKINAEFLKDEYIELQSLINSFDNKVLTIKAWSVTISISGIGTAFVSHSPILLLFASLSAMVFWLLESYWKSFQHPFYDRVEMIEAYFSGELSTITPLQISRSWEAKYDKKIIIKVMFWSNVLIPHIIVFLTGIVLFILSRLSLISV